MQPDESLELRQITFEDREGLLRLYKHLHPSDDLPDPRVLQATWLNYINSPGLYTFVGLADGKIVVSCLLCLIPNLTHGCCPFSVIENVVVHQAYRGRGFGSRILKHATHFAWSKNCYKVMLMTGRPETHEFYEKSGFEKGIKTAFVAKLPPSDE